MGKNRSASGITNVIQYDNNGNISFVSGSTTLMQVSSSGAITTTGVISGSNALSASFSLNSALLNGTGSVGFATTASLLTVSSSQQQISASLLQVSASYISLSGSYNLFSGSASTRITENSSSIQQVSSSQQQISASLLNVISVFATTGSNSFRANQSITGSLTVTGQIIAQTLNVQQVTSSIIYSSGSNNFGCDLNSRQTFTGSFYQTGSVASFSSCVGIGTNAPSYLLHVNSPAPSILLESNCSTGPAYLRFNNTTRSNTNYIALGGTSNDLFFTVNGADRFFISGSGNIGIGTTTPNRHLSIQGPAESWIESITTQPTTQCWLFGQDGSRKGFEVYDLNTTRTRFFVAPTNGNIGIGTTCIISAYGFEKTVSIESCNNAELQLKQTCNNNCFSIGITNGVNYFQSNQGYDFQIAGSTKLRIATSGNVGIGISTPASAHMLQINNPSQNYVRMNMTNTSTGTCNTDGLIFQQEVGNSIIKNQENGYLAFGVNGAETNLVIAQGGNIGIGTASPNATYLQLGDWCNRGGRLLTSNAAGWVGDGKTPSLLITSGNDTSTCKGNAIGLALHNDSQTCGSYTPALVFSRRSYSGIYNSAMAAIVAQSSLCGVDSNWNGGDLVFSTTPNSGYMTESMRITSGGSTCFYGTVLSIAPNNGYNFRGVGFSTGAIATGGSCLIYSSLDRGLYLISIASSVTSTFGYSAFLWVDSSAITASSVIRQSCVTISTSGRALCVVNQYTSETAIMTVTTLNLLNYIG